MPAHATKALSNFGQGFLLGLWQIRAYSSSSFLGAVFFRFLTLSDKRYSICPFMERKSSSAHAESSRHRLSDTLKSICFFSSPFLAMTVLFNKLCRCLQLAGRPCCHTGQRGDCSPLRLCALHQARQRCFRLAF